MNTLEQQVREYYEAQALPVERVRSIVQLSRAVTPSRNIAWAVGAAAAVALVAVILFALNRPPQGDLTQLVMAEIARNHSKHIAPEVATDRYEEVQTKLSRLDFSVLPASEFLRRDFQLVGGRYCSVQSEFAAQLKLRETASGEDCTLYVAPLTPVLRRVKADTRVVDAVRVQVWTEDGRLFGLARDATPQPTEPR
jgi:anti-sigma factor RsiW